MIELAPTFRPRTIRHVFMDWDGTTSLTRGGWTDVMMELFAESLPLRAGEDAAAIRAFSRDELMKLNGRPSIHQMYRLAELIVERGGVALPAAEYQRDYQARIGCVVNARLAKIRSGEALPDSLLVPGVREFFTALNERKIAVSLVSGTPFPELIEEVRLLGLEHHFAAIIGPTGTADRTFSKRTVLDALLHGHALEGSQMLAFGDGPIELIETSAVGGLAVAVATDESQPTQIDAWKRDALLAAGAHAVIANYTAKAELLAALFP